MMHKLTDSHYANNQERTSLLLLKRFQNRIFFIVLRQCFGRPRHYCFYLLF